MSNKIQIQMSKRVWKDKLDFFFSQPVDQFYNSIEIFETAETSKIVAINTTTKNSKFMKFFKVESQSEDELTSASAGENSSGDCELNSRGKSMVSMPIKTKLTSILKNGWDVSIQKQRALLLCRILSRLQKNENILKRLNSRVQGNSRNQKKGRDTFKKNHNGLS